MVSWFDSSYPHQVSKECIQQSKSIRKLEKKHTLIIQRNDMAHKIAIIKVKEYYPGYGDDGYEMIVQSITDWEEVSDEDYRVLKTAQSQLGYIVLEQPVDTPKFIAKTIADYKAWVLAEEERRQKEAKERADKALERKMKKSLKDKQSKLEMFKKLQEELGPDALA